MKGRIALYAGYFVAMLLLAAYLTGVLELGILPRLHSQQPTISDQPSAPQGPVVSSSNPPMQTSVLTEPLAPPASSRRSVISDQEKLLADKRAEFQRLEELIRRRKKEISMEEKLLAELKASRATLTKERDARREVGVKKLAKLYEGMEPEAAASILSKLEKDMAAEILISMKDRQASRVLAAMNGQKAREMSERIQEARLDQTAGREPVGEVIR